VTAGLCWHFTGLRWEEAVAVLSDSVNLDGQSMVIERLSRPQRRQLRAAIPLPD
jgi:hypothetical protein